MTKRTKKRERESISEYLKDHHLIYGLEGRLHYSTSEHRSEGPIYINDRLILSDSFSVPEVSITAAGLSELIAGEVIADIIRVWDCDEQRWCDDTPIIIRMEDDDLTLWRDATGHVHWYVGPIATERSIQAFNNSVTRWIEAGDPILRWRSDSKQNRFIGEMIECVSIMNCDKFGLITLPLCIHPDELLTFSDRFINVIAHLGRWSMSIVYAHCRPMPDWREHLEETYERLSNHKPLLQLRAHSNGSKLR